MLEMVRSKKRTGQLCGFIVYIVHMIFRETYFDKSHFHARQLRVFASILIIFWEKRVPVLLDLVLFLLGSIYQTTFFILISFYLI